MTKRFSFLAILLYGLFGLLNTAEAVTYKYIDNSGMVCFADDLQSIPDQYRSQAVLIEGQLDEKPVRTAGTPSGPVIAPQAAEPATASAQLLPAETLPVKGSHSVFGSFSVRLIVTTLVGLGLVVLLAYLSKVPKFQDRLHRISIRTAAGIIFLLCLAIVHGKDMLLIARMATRAVNNMQQQSAQKGQRAAEGIKKLDALFDEMQKTEDEFKREEAAGNR